ncbi:MAG TPA: glycosyltransferase family 2 protein, partial [Thermoanaerobaculia bacterium]|nr:glycosyltransferase family 2 protein [Thermoanaerobaculia bacterium]
MRASVIIPCRNGERIVGEAVRSALAQSEPPLEVLVVDDASTDSTSEAARSAGATVLRLKERANAGGARNRGIEEARGDTLAFLDADVAAPRDWLERVRRTFDRDPDTVAVGGSVRNGRPGLFGDLDLYLNHSEWIGGRPSYRGLIPTLGVVYRRDAVGPTRFVETNLGEDASFGAAVLSRGGKLWYDPGIVMTHRHERLDRK